MASISIAVRVYILADHYILLQIGNHWSLKDIWELPIGAKHDN